MRSTYRSLQVIFFVNGAGLASFVPHIPTAQARLGVGPGVLGLALLALGLGALVSMPVTGGLVARFGSRSAVRVSLVTFLAALPLPLLAGTTPSFAAALLLLGAASGALDVSMNAQAVALEALSSSPFLSRLHALFSAGGLAGAACAGVALHGGVSPERHLLLATACLAVAGLSALAHLLTPDQDLGKEPTGLARPAGALAGLGVLAFLALLAEGAMADWSAVYFRSLGATPASAAAGFAGFSLAMTAGRWVGDSLVLWAGELTLLRASATLAAVGFGTSLIVGRPTAALAGCVCMGLGLSNVVPVLFRAAGRAPGIPPGHGIAAMTTVGYCGLLAGPPVIGFVAEWATLSAALWLVAASAGVIAAWPLPRSFGARLQ
jgi:hypothetical protein